MTNLEVNPNKEYILAGDISASMQTIDPACGGNTRYQYMLEKFKLFIKTAEEYDPHGPTVLLFGENVYTFPDVTLEEVDPVLNKVKFEGFTNLDVAIGQAYKLHIAKKNEMKAAGETHEGTNLLVFTDGAPSSKIGVMRIIADIANAIATQDEFNITILTVGTIEPELAKYLAGLHDDIEKYLKQDFDIIHIMPLDKTTFLKSVSGAFTHESKEKTPEVKKISDYF